MAKQINMAMKMLAPLLTLLMHVNAQELVVEAPMEVAIFNGTLYATCELTPDSYLPTDQPKLYGQVLFKQIFPAGTLQVMINVNGIPVDDQQKRAIHVHQYGDMSQGCISAGPHYNPLRMDHPSHPGDLGNYLSSNGTIRQYLNIKGATLFGAQSMLGRSVVIHEKEDDLGLGADEESKRSGNAGRRIAGCVIGISSPDLWSKNIKLIKEVEQVNK